MALAPSVLKNINAKLNFLYQKSIYLIPAFKRLLCNALIQPHLCMFFMASSLKEKFKNQTSKRSKQIYLFLPKFTFEISYRSIAYQKCKVTSRQRQSRTRRYRPVLSKKVLEIQTTIECRFNLKRARDMKRTYSQINPSMKYVKQPLLSCIL